MIKQGILSLVRFPQSDLDNGKYRPVLVLAPVPGPFDDWIVCAVTSQLRHEIPDWDELIDEKAPDYQLSGLKTASLIRIGKLAALNRQILEGKLGEIGKERYERIMKNLSGYLTEFIDK